MCFLLNTDKLAPGRVRAVPVKCKKFMMACKNFNYIFVNGFPHNFAARIRLRYVPTSRGVSQFWIDLDGYDMDFNRDWNDDFDGYRDLSLFIQFSDAS